MKIKVVTNKDQIDISIAGNIDETGAEKLENSFNKLDISQVKQVNINFRQIEYIGSAGVGSLLLLYKKLALLNGKIIINEIPKEIYALLMHDMNLGQIFTLKSI